MNLKIDRDTEYVTSLKSKGVFEWKSLPLHGAFIPNVKQFGTKIGIQFNNTPLVIDQTNLTNKILNAYIVYDLDNWPKIPLNNTFLFGAINTAKNNDKNKYAYSGYGIAFDGLGPWSFSNDFARNALIFDIDNSSSSHTANLKNNFLVLVDTFGINGSFGAPEKTFSINLSIAKTKLCLSLLYNGDNSYLFVNGETSLSLQQIMKMLTFQINLV